MMVITNVVYVLAFFTVLYWVARKRRSHAGPTEQNHGVYDQEILSAAELAVKDVNLQEEFAEMYDLLGSYSTLQAYSEDYMIQIVQMLEKNNITADFLFVESGPAGMMSYTQRQGTFELYVQKGMTEVAEEKIRSFVDSTTSSS